MRGPSGALLSRLRDNALKQAAANVVISDGMGAILAERTIPDQTIKVIHNWTNDETIQPLESSANELRAKWGLRGHFIVGYSGNLGRAHEIETVLGAARILKQRKDIRFLFIGGGHLVRSLQQRAAADGTGEMFEFRPHQDREQLSMSLTAADVHLVSLRPEVEGLVFPSKFYGIAAAGRPVVAVADPRSELAAIVMRERCGVVVRPGDGEGLAAAICELQANPEQREALGRQGRALLDRRYSRAHALRLWSSLVAEVAAS
jgi:glycosyltransferase involved in cell wall biosynthesis